MNISSSNYAKPYHAKSHLARPDRILPNPALSDQAMACHALLNYKKLIDSVSQEGNS